MAALKTGEKKVGYFKVKLYSICCFKQVKLVYVFLSVSKFWCLNPIKAPNSENIKSSLPESCKNKSIMRLKYRVEMMVEGHKGRRYKVDESKVLFLPLEPLSWS